MLAFKSTDVEKTFGFTNAAEATFVDVEIEPKSIYKYSPFTDQFGANAHSTPPPTVQPTSVSELLDAPEAVFAGLLVDCRYALR